MSIRTRKAVSISCFAQSSGALDVSSYEKKITFTDVNTEFINLVLLGDY